MPFERGHRKFGGRKKGTRNKNNAPLFEKAKELKIDPFEVLLHFAKGDWKALGYESETITVYSKDVVNEEYTIQPIVRQRAAAEACQYLYPKLKAIEHTGEIDANAQAQLIILPANGRERAKLLEDDDEE